MTGVASPQLRAPRGHGTNVPEFKPILSGWPRGGSARCEHSMRSQTPQQDRGADLAAEER